MLAFESKSFTHLLIIPAREESERSLLSTAKHMHAALTRSLRRPQLPRGSGILSSSVGSGENIGNGDSLKLADAGGVEVEDSVGIGVGSNASSGEGGTINDSLGKVVANMSDVALVPRDLVVVAVVVDLRTLSIAVVVVVL